MDNTDHTSQYSETEEKIFVAALEEFSRKGRSGARMQDIADRAGINKALIHYYFRSKDKLYEEVFTFVIRRYFFSISKVLSKKESFADTLRSFIDIYIDLLEDQPALPFLLLRDIGEGTEVFRQKIKSVMLPFTRNVPRVFTEKYKAAVARGEIRDEDPAQVIITMIGASVYFYIGYPILQEMFPQVQKRKAFIKKRKEHLFNTLYYGLLVRPE